MKKIRGVSFNCEGRVCPLLQTELPVVITTSVQSPSSDFGSQTRFRNLCPKHYLRKLKIGMDILNTRRVIISNSVSEYTVMTDRDPLQTQDVISPIRSVLFYVLPC